MPQLMVRHTRNLEGQSLPVPLPLVMEYVPPAGRSLSVFERLELVDWGFKGASHQRCMLRVEHGAGGAFLLVRVKLCGKTRQLRTVELRLNYISKAVRQRIESGDRGSWVPADTPPAIETFKPCSRP